MGQAGGPWPAWPFVPCRPGHGAGRAVPPMAVPKGRAVGRAAGPWAVCTPTITTDLQFITTDLQFITTRMDLLASIRMSS
jgi:hypothetical protein